MATYDYERRTAAVPPDAARQTAYKVIREMGRPASNRAGVIKQIAQAVSKSPLLLQYLAEYDKIDAHTVPDLLGDAVAKWKDDWEIGEGSAQEEEFDGLTTDSGLRAAIVKKVEEHKAKGGQGSDIKLPVNFSEAHIQARWLLDTLDKLAHGKSRNEGEDHKKALEMAEKIVGLLKKS